MKQARNYLIELYDDYRNNYLTVAVFAEHHGLLEVEAAFLIDLARRVAGHPHPEA